MFNNINETNIEIAMLLIFSTTAFIAFLSGYRFAKRRERRENEMCNLMYRLLIKSNNIDDSLISLKEDVENYKNETDRIIERINALGSLETKNANTISSLTSSINNVIIENKKRSEEKILPTPQLSEMINTTISEYVRQEITFMRDMRIPVSPKDPITVRISKYTIQTYPHVDEEWIMRKVISSLTSIESMEILIDKMQATKTNKDFLKYLELESQRNINV